MPPFLTSRLAAVRTVLRLSSIKWRWGGVLGILLGVLWGIMTWQNRLQSQERLLVGDWLTVNRYADGTTCARNWTFRGDRKCQIVNIYSYAATPLRKGYRDVDQTDATWSLQNGRLVIDPVRPLRKRLHIQSAVLFHRVRNALLGTTGGVIDGEICEGAMQFQGTEKLVITWWDPIKQSSSSTQHWIRRPGDQWVNAPELSRLP